MCFVQEIPQEKSDTLAADFPAVRESVLLQFDPFANCPVDAPPRTLVTSVDSSALQCFNNSQEPSPSDQDQESQIPVSH